MTLNVAYKPEKIKEICKKLKEDPLISIEELEDKLSLKNYFFSVYEKIFVLQS